MPRDKISYSRGFPYGAPLAIVRGGATNDKGVQEFLKAQGFVHEPRKPTFGWKSYKDGEEFAEILAILRDTFGCDVQPKAHLDPSYILELPEPTDGEDD